MGGWFFFPVVVDGVGMGLLCLDGQICWVESDKEEEREKYN